MKKQNTKICTQCKCEKETTEYYKESRNKDKLSSICKVCIKSNLEKYKNKEHKNIKPINIDSFYKIGKPIKIPKKGLKTTKEILKFSKFYENV